MEINEAFSAVAGGCIQQTLATIITIITPFQNNSSGCSSGCRSELPRVSGSLRRSRTPGLPRTPMFPSFFCQILTFPLPAGPMTSCAYRGMSAIPGPPAAQPLPRARPPRTLQPTREAPSSGNTKCGPITIQTPFRVLFCPPLSYGASRRSNPVWNASRENLGKAGKLSACTEALTAGGSWPLGDRRSRLNLVITVNG